MELLQSTGAISTGEPSN